MKHTTLFLALSISILPINNLINNTNEVIGNEANTLNLQPDPGSEKMTAVIFRAQDFCRAELKDFEFDAEFRIISATIYFSGENFRNTESGTINSSSLKPVKHLMKRCVPGSIVVFDNVKVMGPDKQVRPIAGLSLILH
ncbi:MAG: GldM family protein [Ferruginibacter sp.]